MISPEAQRAIADAVSHGRALLKFISPNDTGLTKSHQAGFYLPKGARDLFTLHAPTKGKNTDTPVRVRWHDGRVTESVVKWYGQGTRSEYRLTRFGRKFPWRTHDMVGALLVLIPVGRGEMLAYVLDREDDIEEIQAALDVYVVDWAVYPDGEPGGEAPDACIDRLFHEFVATVNAFPKMKEMSGRAREVVFTCMREFAQRGVDEQLLTFIRNEVALFRMVEQKLYGPVVTRVFRDIEDFVKTALPIINARKTRAGSALENHLEYLLREAGLRFEMRPRVEGTSPDILLPGKREYDDALVGRYPVEKLIMVGLKTTCKDRWRQVLSEAPKIPTKHLLTLQAGISPRQLDEMHRSNIVLIVPTDLQKVFPKGSPVKMLDLAAFVESARKIVG